MKENFGNVKNERSIKLHIGDSMSLEAHKTFLFTIILNFLSLRMSEFSLFCEVRRYFDIDVR